MLALFSNRSYFVHLLLVTVATFTLGLVSTIHAQETTYDASFSSSVKEAIPINVLVGQSRVINFDRPIGRFSISNPEIAEAVMVRPDQVLVNGKAFGQVNFIAWEKSDSKFIVFDVFVRANLSLIDSQMRALFPRDDIRLSQANGSVVLSGTVTDLATVAQADAVVQAAGFKTVNMLASPVKNAMQVQLQIRVAEVSRNKLRELGSSFAYQGGPGSGGFISGGGPASLSEVAEGFMKGAFNPAMNVFLMGGNTLNMIRAMQTNGALRALAEPNLIAMDGQVASFLAGGEFPIPVVQSGGGGGGNAVTIQFKEYGIRLNFKPTIIDEDHIKLELEPEVSTIDFANGVRFQGFVVPALRTRRARTGVELRDGQSFALAGLLDNSETRSLSKVPVIGDIPILGNLFKSTQFQKQETELVFIVTAELVKPVNRDDLPNMRSIDGLKNGSPLGMEPKGEGISGASGFSTRSGTQAPATTPAATPAATTPAEAPKKTEDKTKTAPTTGATRLTP
ncbi:MAG TPA: pilus assembly protein N-terminal domain-containing protein [Pyrinomonadaceae bacterium]|nr:pilus assembly protein N-terminal domain-containing protein [Pyrinomonadaceae bacterium]